MLLRWLLVLVLLLNAGYFAWSQHWLAPIGWAPVQLGEPERVQQQIQPDAIRVEADDGRMPAVVAQEAASATAPADDGEQPPAP